MWEKGWCPWYWKGRGGGWEVWRRASIGGKFGVGVVDPDTKLHHQKPHGSSPRGPVQKPRFSYYRTPVTVQTNRWRDEQRVCLFQGWTNFLVSEIHAPINHRLIRTSQDIRQRGADTDRQTDNARLRTTNHPDWDKAAICQSCYHHRVCNES
jgi:hypothetical protein